MAFIVKLIQEPSVLLIDSEEKVLVIILVVVNYSLKFFYSSDFGTYDCLNLLIKGFLLFKLLL
jgi:hypothetical protein